LCCSCVSTQLAKRFETGPCTRIAEKKCVTWSPIPTQDNTTQKAADKHPRLKRDSNPRSQQLTSQDPRLRQHGHCDRQRSAMHKVKWEFFEINSGGSNKVEFHTWDTKICFEIKTSHLFYCMKKKSTGNLMVTNSDMCKTESLCEVLGPYEEATDVLWGQNSATDRMLRPCFII
jgi:hypothetical protein